MAELKPMTKPRELIENMQSIDPMLAAGLGLVAHGSIRQPLFETQKEPDMVDVLSATIVSYDPKYDGSDQEISYRTAVFGGVGSEKLEMLDSDADRLTKGEEGHSEMMPSVFRQCVDLNSFSAGALEISDQTIGGILLVRPLLHQEAKGRSESAYVRFASERLYEVLEGYLDKFSVRATLKAFRLSKSFRDAENEARQNGELSLAQMIPMANYANLASRARKRGNTVAVDRRFATVI